MKGEAVKDNAERLQLAYRAHETRLYADSARMYGEAFEADPKLADDRQSQHRYNAACPAVLAADPGGPLTLPSPEGEGAALGDDERARVRGQALLWLKAELADWAKLLESGNAEQCSAIAKTLQWWQEDTDLAGVRGDAIDELPESERAAWRALWAEVDALLAKARRELAGVAADGVDEGFPAEPFAR
jgi:hypothetical protein